MRKSKGIWIYAFLLHDFIKLSLVPHRGPERNCAAFLQPDLRRTATRRIYIIADAEMNFKCFLPNPVAASFCCFLCVLPVVHNVIREVMADFSVFIARPQSCTPWQLLKEPPISSCEIGGSFRDRGKPFQTEWLPFFNSFPAGSRPRRSTAARGRPRTPSPCGE